MLKSDGHRRDLVLVGGGHTHVQVLKRFAMEPPPSTRISVVVDTPVAVYSGMVPGFVAGQYAAEELEIDVVPLARRAGARVILSRATGVDPVEHRISLAGRPAIAYDLASFDIGSTIAGLEVPGVATSALPTRPIGRFVGAVDEALARARDSPLARRFQVVVVGGGVGGVELAFTLLERLGKEGLKSVDMTVVHAGPRVLPGASERFVRRTELCAKARGITLRCGSTVVEVVGDEVCLDDASRLPYDLLVWVTGAVAQPIFRESGLPVEERGFVLTRSTLQVAGHDDLFAVGDCATLVDYRDTPKAGVYAVRQGPYLIDNLRAALDGSSLREYRPQQDFLALLNLGDGSAIGGKWGLAFVGPNVMRLKDGIDRRFMEKFQVLEAGGAPTAEFPAMEAETEMLCGGCAAKVGQSVLDRALARLEPREQGADVLLGLPSADDAVAVRTPSGDVQATTVDMFSAFTDDPWIVGRASAVNAASDLLACGVRPRHAMAVVAIPEDMSEVEAEETLYQVLAGALTAFDELGVELLGGHTTTAQRLMVGFSVDGFADPDRGLFRKDALREGQALFLTKPLGTGVLFHADMQGLARGPWMVAALASVVATNLAAFEAIDELGVDAVTDVTGFGIAGHLGEMARASGVGAVVRVEALPALDGAVELLSRGLRSTFHEENERARRGIVVASVAATSSRLPLLFDPQTSGGFLFGIDADLVADVEARLGAAGVWRIGEVVAAREDGTPIEVR